MKNYFKSMEIRIFKNHIQMIYGIERTTNKNSLLTFPLHASFCLKDLAHL